MKLSRHTLFLGFAVIAAVSALVSTMALSFQYAEIGKLTRANTLSTIEERLKGVFTAINNFPGSAGQELLFLRNLSCPEDFEHFLANTDAYQALYLFDSDNGCALKIDAGRLASGEAAADCGRVPEVVLTALERARGLAADAMYISPLVLYENTPSLLYATVRPDQAVVVSVIDADYFLEEVRRLTRTGEAVYLVSRDGGYLAHPEHDNEKLAGGDANFYRDFPAVPGGALDDPALGRFETDSRLFMFWRIYPSASNFALYEGASAVYGAEHASENYWVMTVVSEKLPRQSWWQQTSYLATVTLIVFLHSALAAWLYLAVHNRYARTYD